MGDDMVVRAFPVLPGKEAEVRAFADAVNGSRASEAHAFYTSLGVERETWYLQQTKHGWLFLGATRITDRPLADAAEQYAASDHTFDRWFKDRLKALTGIDPDVQPAGPPSECIFDSATLGAGSASEV